MPITAKDLTDGQEPISHAEIDFLQSLARSLPSRPTIVNIGAATGVSTVAFLEIIPTATIWSVDVLPCQAEFDNVRRAGRNPERVTRLLGDSKRLGPEFPFQCDMIFIDGDHWGAYADIEAWVYTNKVKDNGIIAFHDYQEVCAPNNPGSVYEDVNRGMVGYVYIGTVDRVIAFRNAKRVI